ncbi:MAG: hypothetical protein O2856_09195, partial [Planctomycetota bacterium]|nr:hypothetical protein [Planctomycetota bacterium]
NGFYFKGYTLDASGVPSFRYQWNEVSITDSFSPFVASPDNGLKRTLVVQSTDRLENAYLRIAVDQKIEVHDGTVAVNGMNLKFEGVEPIVRTIDGRRELLVQVQLNADGQVTIHYTILW